MNEDDTAEFKCEVDANPFNENTIQWDLPDHRNEFEPGRSWRDRSQVDLDVEKSTSILRLNGIERSDMGRIVCAASNGVKDSIQTAVSYLVVNRK